MVGECEVRYTVQTFARMNAQEVDTEYNFFVFSKTYLFELSHTNSCKCHIDFHSFISLVNFSIGAFHSYLIN